MSVAMLLYLEVPFTPRKCATILEVRDYLLTVFTEDFDVTFTANISLAAWRLYSFCFRTKR